MDMCSTEHLYEKLQVLENEERPLSRKERMAAMKGPLLAWYEEHRRSLPWRETPEPYRVWVSEIMLQQTRVEAVKPYFHRFMEALPTVEALAEAPEEQLLKLWEGLGYYNRVRNLQKAAVIMVEAYGGQPPTSYEELLKLPGIGSYTAGAIASIAYGIPVPAVDGNVLRVLSRVLASEEDILKQSVKKQMEADLKEMIPADKASQFNQSLIETGAIICVPNGQPKCGDCPLFSICLARKRGLLDSIPYKTPRKPRRVEERTVLLVEMGEQIVIHKRPDSGLLASLYEFLNLEGYVTESRVRDMFQNAGGYPVRIEPLPPAKHIFSHVEWHMTGYRVMVEQWDSDWGIMVPKVELKTKYPLPNAFRAYTEMITREI